MHVVYSALNVFHRKCTLHMGCACAIDFMLSVAAAEAYLEVYYKSHRIEGQ